MALHKYIRGAEHRWDEVPKLVGEAHKMWQPNVSASGLRDYRPKYFEYKAPTWQQLELFERKFEATHTRANVYLNTLTQRMGPGGVLMQTDNKGRPEGFAPRSPPPRPAWWNRLATHQDRHRAETAPGDSRASRSRQRQNPLIRSSPAHASTRAMRSADGLPQTRGWLAGWR